MSLLRHQRLPHIAFLLVLALVAIVGSRRIMRQVVAQGPADDAWRTASMALRGVELRHRSLVELRLALAESRREAEERADYDLKSYRAALIQYPGGALPVAAVPELQQEMERLEAAGTRLKSALPTEPEPDPEMLSRGWFVAQDMTLQGFQALAARLEAAWYARHEAAMTEWRALNSRLVRELVLLFALLVMAGATYYYVVSLRIRQPLRHLADTARAVTNGDLDARALSTGDGPVDSLAEDVNVMIDVLVETVTNESRVIEELQRKAADLERANYHKSTFVANVSHELKTPLNAIIGFADILAAGRHGELNERQRDYLQRIFRAGNHLLGLITDLIDMSKIDVGAISLQPETFPVTTVLEEVVELVAPDADRSELTVQPDWPAALGSMTQDRRRVKQILLNLLGNAVKFTPAHGELSLSADADADWIHVRVRDSGIGIDPAEQERIFEDFVQLDSALHRQREGTGIGLALSRRLAGLMGGDIQVSSAPGKGSTFTLTLPRTQPPAPDAMAADRPSPPAGEV